MAEQDSTSPVRGQPEPSSGKSTKRKATVKRSSAPAPSASPGGSSELTETGTREAGQGRVPNGEQDRRQLVIQERAYWLWEAGGFQHGHDLDYWLEAERQVDGSDRRSG